MKINHKKIMKEISRLQIILAATVNENTRASLKAQIESKKQLLEENNNA